MSPTVGCCSLTKLKGSVPTFYLLPPCLHTRANRGDLSSWRVPGCLCEMVPVGLFVSGKHADFFKVLPVQLGCANSAAPPPPPQPMRDAV